MNLVILVRGRGAVKYDFQPYLRQYTSPKENFEYCYPLSNAILKSCLKFDYYSLRKATRHKAKCGVINEVKKQVH